MSLCPSNTIAEDINGGRKVFPNLARCVSESPWSKEKPALLSDAQAIFEEVDKTIRAELTAAGIPDKLNENGSEGIFDMAFGNFESCRMSNGCFPEVPAKLVGITHRWTFERAWRYYIAKGPGIPPEFAIPFDKEWGTQVRVDGDCACRGAEFWGEGFGIDMYHIDTPEGLKAFVELLAKIHTPRPS